MLPLHQPLRRSNNAVLSSSWSVPFRETHLWAMGSQLWPTTHSPNLNIFIDQQALSVPTWNYGFNLLNGFEVQSAGAGIFLVSDGRFLCLFYSFFPYQKLPKWGILQHLPKTAEIGDIATTHDTPIGTPPISAVWVGMGAPNQVGFGWTWTHIHWKSTKSLLLCTTLSMPNTLQAVWWTQGRMMQSSLSRYVNSGKDDAILPLHR